MQEESGEGHETDGPAGDPADEPEHVTVNRANWDARVPHHAASVEYGLDRYLADPTRISDVVTFDRPRLGDIAGLDGVHLQCHIGTDTLSLHRLGARMTGLDFSELALEVARGSAADCGADISYVNGQVEAAPDLLGAERFDLVYTGIGALCWLPDIERWAQAVRGLLRPGGRLFIREGHPVLWALEDARPDGELVLRYPYFAGRAIEFDEPGTYVTFEGELASTRTIEFNHGLGEILTAVLDVGLEITTFVEHDSVPWEALVGQMDELPGGEWRLREQPERLPHTYTLVATRPR